MAYSFTLNNYNATSTSPVSLYTNYQEKTVNNCKIYLRYRIDYYRSSKSWIIGAIYGEVYRSGSNYYDLSVDSSSIVTSCSGWDVQPTPTKTGYTVIWPDVSTSRDNPNTISRIVTSGGRIYGKSSGTIVVHTPVKFKDGATVIESRTLSETMTFNGSQIEFTIKFFNGETKISEKTFIYGQGWTTLGSQRRTGEVKITYKSSGTNDGKESKYSWYNYSDYWYNQYSEGVRYENSKTYYVNGDQTLWAHFSGSQSVTVSSFLTSTKGSYTEQYYYTVYFYNNGSLFATKDTNKGKIITTYSFRGWECDKDGKLYGGSEGAKSIVLYNNVTFTAKFSSSVSGERVPLKLSGLPSKPGYKGHKFVGWFFDGGEQVTSASMLESNRNAYAEWTPVDYKVSFDLNGGKMPTGEPRPSAFTKTYGTGVYLPTVEPLRVGYKFVGWGLKNGSVTPQAAGTLMDDRVYNVTYTDTTTGPVTLFAIWDYKPNTVKLVYWYNDSASQETTDTYQYNIDMGTVRYGAPEPPKIRSGDYVFLGWSDLRPNEWLDQTKINAGYHGVYNIPPQEIVVTDEQQIVHKSSIDLPLFIETSKLTKEEQWGTEKYYYGIWAKTGKYIMVNGQWKKVSNAYVRVGDKWRQVTGMWSFVNGNWKEEI